MKTNLLILIGIVMITNGCGGYSSIKYDPLPVTTIDFSTERKNTISAVDSNNINLMYPSRSKDYHIIPVKDYLFAKLLSSVPENVGITSMKVTKFQSKCDGRGVFGPKLWCISSIEISYTINKKDKIINVHSESDVGPVFAPGDIAPPINWGSSLQNSVHKQAMEAMDSLTKNIVNKLEENK